MSELSTSLSEFAGYGAKANARAFGCPTPKATQQVTVSGSAAYSTVLPANGHFRMLTTVDCFISVSVDGATPASTATDMLLIGGNPEVVYLGQTAANVKYTFVSAITTGATGTLYITPLEGI